MCDLLHLVAIWLIADYCLLLDKEIYNEVCSLE